VPEVGEGKLVVCHPQVHALQAICGKLRSVTGDQVNEGGYWLTTPPPCLHVVPVSGTDAWPVVVDEFVEMKMAQKKEKTKSETEKP